MTTWDLLAQSVEDIEKINESIDVSALTTQDVLIAVLVVLLSFPISSFLGNIAKKLLVKAFDSTGHEPPEHIVNLLKRTLVWLLRLIALGWAAAIIGVDVGWVTIIFAFVGVLFVLVVRPLIENTAAGLLLQSRSAFSIGDEITSNDYTGKVIEINARSTVLLTSDWRKVHIPNTEVLTESIVVYTTSPRRSTTLKLNIDYQTDIEIVERLVLKAVSGSKGVLKKPAPVIRSKGFGYKSYELAVSWWHKPSLGDSSTTLDQVIRVVKKVLQSEGIAMPSVQIIVSK